MMKKVIERAKIISVTSTSLTGRRAKSLRAGVWRTEIRSVRLMIRDGKVFNLGAQWGADSRDLFYNILVLLGRDKQLLIIPSVVDVG